MYKLMNKKLMFLLVVFLIIPFVTVVAQDDTTTEPTTNSGVYVVKKGDTLSSIAQEHLGSASKWQDILKLNPQIKDPNKLKIGQKINLTDSTIEKTEPTTEAPKTDTTDGGISEETLTFPEYSSPPETVTVPEKRKEKFTFKAYGMYTIPKVNISGFISQKELEDSGFIFRSRHDREMITDDNIVFIKLPKKRMIELKQNDRFTIFTVLKKVKHPITRKKVGYAVKAVGNLEITSLGEDTASAIIMAASDVIKVKDKITPYKLTNEKVLIVKGEYPVVGYIIFSLKESMDILKNNLLSDNDVVFLDRGYADGVRVGNVFDVLRITKKYNTRKLTAEEYERMLDKGGDPNSKRVVYPPDIIGQIVVINVGEYTSTAVISKSNDVIHLGDMIRLQIE